MNDRALSKAMRLIAECERRSGTAQPKTVEMLDQGAARLDALRWRSVEDEAPGLEVKVDGYGISGLDYRSMHSVMVVYRDHLGRYMEDRGARALPAIITHWRPRPAPPGEGE